MRIETTTRKLFKFNELSEKAQDTAVEKLYDLNVDHEWWEYIYDDAKNIGAKITEFDLDRRNGIKFRFTLSPGKVAAKILANHGNGCETFKLAQQFKMDKDAEELERALGLGYLSILKKEYEYQTSREVIIESIKANDYEFTEDGRLA